MATARPLHIVHMAGTENGAPWMIAFLREQRRMGHKVTAIISGSVCDGCSISAGTSSRSTLASVPEPAGFGLLCLGFFTLCRRPRSLPGALRPDLVVDDLRGNLDTRLAAVAAGRYDAAILALSGMKRLGRDAEASEILDVETWLPAVGQGALGIVP